MAVRTDGGALGWAVRSVLLAMAVYVGSNFVRSITLALSFATEHQAVRAAQPRPPSPRTFGAQPVQFRSMPHGTKPWSHELDCFNRGQVTRAADQACRSRVLQTART